jgi:plasmid stabilization system protein ParE
MAYSFTLREEAVKDFTDAYVWHEEQQDGLGGQFRIEFQKKLELICNNPFHYKKPYKRFHEALTDRFPFLIVYTVEEKINQIVVIAIFHTSRNPKNKFRR